MTLTLPTEPSRARSLTDIVPHLLRSLGGDSDWLRPARSAVLFLVDGLGSHNLSAAAGHARTLSRADGITRPGRTVFPSTTASALTSLLTGEPPGRHGIVGYRARVPGTDHIVNQLRGWDSGLLTLPWQRASPLMAGSRPSFVVTKREYQHTGFTDATQADAQFHGVDDLDERVERAADLAAEHAGAFVYLYAPELDSAGHRYGWESDNWLSELERVDAAAGRLTDRAGSDTGVLITADHGMVDVPRSEHVLLTEGDGLTDDVHLIGGEPRMLHLYATPGRADAVARSWRAREAARSWVLTRDEAIEAGLFGQVDPEVRARIGDVLVAARSLIAYYDDRVAEKGAQRMIGQHGSLTAEERTVPLLRLGAYANPV